MVTADVKQAAVIVSRWYGGIQLGPKRFRCIVQAAADALQMAGVCQTKREDLLVE
jgi:putative IMPACT (imprinted ancient) family translation regulator